MKRRPWLVLLLWLLVPALAAVLPWAWRRSRTPMHPPQRALPPLTLTGDTRKDRRAILERAALRLLPADQDSAFPAEGPVERVALLGNIGVELLPLDPTQGKAVVDEAIDMATRPADRVTRDDLDAPERTRIGLLVHLARSLRSSPDLAEHALRTAYEETRGVRDPVSQVYALCLFAREAEDIDPTRSRSAVRKARGVLFAVPLSAASDPFAAAADAVARLDGRAAARPLVERALVAIPSTPARPLVEARLAARLAAAAPNRARSLARQALADVGGPELTSSPQTLGHLNSRQLHDIAVILAVTHLDVAREAVARIVDPAERAATLTEMGGVVEPHFPSRAATCFRQALRQARAIPDRQARSAAVTSAAKGLAAYDLTTARAAVLGLPIPISHNDMLTLGGRAARREPEAARRLIERMRDGDPANGGRIEGSDEISLAQVTAEPDLHRALAMAQQGANPELQAAALLTVARRLKLRPSL